MVISQSHAMCGYVLPNTMNKEMWRANMLKYSS